MKTINDIIRTAQDRGIELSPDGNHLRYCAPEGSLDDRLKEELIRNKPEILAALKHPTATYYEDDIERWIKTCDGRFWFEDKRTGERTELIPGNPPQDEPLPQGFFEAFGKLLGHIIKKRSQ
jgi:hypothetical protein